MKKPRTGHVYIFRRAGWDALDPRAHHPVDGSIVRIAKPPYGAPANGVMGHCYIETTEGRFIGLVALSSLCKR